MTQTAVYSRALMQDLPPCSCCGRFYRNHDILVLLDFHFTGKVPRVKRFKYVEVMVAFRMKDGQLRHQNEPIVRHRVVGTMFDIDSTQGEGETMPGERQIPREPQPRQDWHWRWMLQDHGGERGGEHHAAF